MKYHIYEVGEPEKNKYKSFYDLLHIQQMLVLYSEVFQTTLRSIPLPFSMCLVPNKTKDALYNFASFPEHFPGYHVYNL